MHDLLKQLDDLQRRDFLALAAKSCLGVSVLPFWQGGTLAAAEATSVGQAEHVIYLFMNGAMSHLETLDPKPGAESQGPTKAIPTAIPGIGFSEHVPKLARVANRMAIVRSMSTETGAHEQGRYLMRTSYKPLPTIRHPALGAWTQKFLGKRNNDLPGNVVVGGADRHPGAGFLGADFSPAPVENAKSGLLNTKSPGYLSDRQFATRMRLSRDFDRAFQRKFEDAAVQSYVRLLPRCNSPDEQQQAGGVRHQGRAG